MPTKLLTYKQIVISGWYGFGNLGDEAILYAIANSIKKHTANTEIAALSFNPDFTSKYQNINSYHQLPYGLKSWTKALLKRQVFSTLMAFVRCDVLIIGGGGFLSDWQPEAPWTWLRQALIAKLLGKQVILYGIGAGPFVRKIGSWITRTIINNCVDVITVRDMESKRQLESTGVPGINIIVTADPAVNYPLSNSSDTAHFSPKTVGICIAPIFHSEKYWPGKKYKYQRYIQSMNSVVAGLIEKGFTVKFISMQESTDVDFGREIIKGLHCNADFIPPGKSLDESIDQLSKVDILITMRYHAAILGTLQGIPVAAIIYHHKVSEFIHKINMQEFSENLGDGSNWHESDIDAARLIGNVNRIAANYKKIKEMINDRMILLQNEELNNHLNLAKLLEKCD